MNEVSYLSAYRVQKAMEQALDRDNRPPPIFPPYPPGAKRLVLRLDVVCEDELDDHMIDMQQREIRKLAEGYAWNVAEWVEEVDENPCEADVGRITPRQEGQDGGDGGDGPD